MKNSVRIKKENNYKCVIGAQILLVSDNYHTVEELTQRVKEIGLDYIVIKPYSQHLSSNTVKYKDMDYSELLYLNEQLEKYNSENFSVVFRINTMEKLIVKTERYERCGSVPFFWAYITADGDVYGCSAFLGNEKFCYGDINKNTFQEIWEGERRKEAVEFMKNDLNIEQCRINCRMDEINRYLWELLHPTDHVNFI